VTIEEFQTKLDALIKTLSASGFDAVPDSVIADLTDIEKESDNLGMKSGKKLVSNLIDALKTHKAGGNSDESVQVRVVALDFYLKNLQTGSTEDL